jgi:hypothetical protein
MLSITTKLKSILTLILVLKFERLTDFNGNVAAKYIYLSFRSIIFMISGLWDQNYQLETYVIGG